MYDELNAPLEPGCFYHIFNQGNARVKVFFKDDNYLYFLKKVDTYLIDFTEIYAFCLMSNHFHLLVRIKDENEIMEKAKKIKELNGFLNRHKKDKNLSGLIISEILRRLFMSYAKAINKQEKRTGSLFRKNFKRKKITDLKYLKQVVIYIHRNPQSHNIFFNFRNYPWSSYSKILEDKITSLKKEEVIDWFGDRENYIANH
jgi:putative transposase